MKCYYFLSVVDLWLSKSILRKVTCRSYLPVIIISSSYLHVALVCSTSYRQLDSSSFVSASVNVSLVGLFFMRVLATLL